MARWPVSRRERSLAAADGRARGRSSGPEGKPGCQHRPRRRPRFYLADWTGALRGPGCGPGPDPVSQRLVTVRERVFLGAEHPATIITAPTWPTSPGWWGSAGRARIQFARLHAGAGAGSRAPSNQKNVDDRANLAYWKGEARGCGGARDKTGSAAAVIERSSGPSTQKRSPTRAYWTAYRGGGGGCGRGPGPVAARCRSRAGHGRRASQTLAARAGLDQWARAGAEP